jgi:hypothetical protein
MARVCVVSNPELGWDCIVGVWATEELARAELETNEDDGWDHSYMYFTHTITE